MRTILFLALSILIIAACVPLSLASSGKCDNTYTICEWSGTDGAGSCYTTGYAQAIQSADVRTDALTGSVSFWYFCTGTYDGMTNEQNTAVILNSDVCTDTCTGFLVEWHEYNDGPGQEPGPGCATFVRTWGPQGSSRDDFGCPVGGPPAQDLPTLG